MKKGLVCLFSALFVILSGFSFNEAQENLAIANNSFTIDLGSCDDFFPYVLSSNDGDFIAIAGNSEVLKIAGGSGEGHLGTVKAIKELDFHPLACFLHGNLLYLFNKSSVLQIDTSSGSCNEYTLNGADIQEASQVCVVNNQYIVYCHSQEDETLVCYNINSGSCFLCSEPIAVYASALYSGFWGNTFFALSNNLGSFCEYTFEKGSISNVGPPVNQMFALPCRVLNETTIVDHNGNIFIKSTNGFELTSFQYSDTHIACLAKDLLIAKTLPNKLSCFNFLSENKEEINSFIFEEDVLNVLTSGDNTIAVLQNEDNRILLARLGTSLAYTVIEPDISETEKPSQDQKRYNIDYESGFIDVPLGTTIKQMKETLLNMGNYQINVTDKQNNPVISGKVKTGIKLHLHDEISSIELTVVVRGDITGTGAVTRNDITAFREHLLSKNILEGAALRAADFNSDGNIDSLDLLLLRKEVF